MSRWIRLAYKEALGGKHINHLVGAVVVKGGRVISKASNYREFNRGFHAEERALRDNKDYKGAIIIVVRKNVKSDFIGMSRPCDTCMKLIKKKGIKKIVYLNNNRDLCIEKVTEK